MISFEFILLGRSTGVKPRNVSKSWVVFASATAAAQEQQRCPVFTNMALCIAPRTLRNAIVYLNRHRTQIRSLINCRFTICGLLKIPRRHNDSGRGHARRIMAARLIRRERRIVLLLLHYCYCFLVQRTKIGNFTVL